MGLLDELLKAQKPKRNLMGTQMVKGPDQPYLRQDYPGLYGALGGLLATAPDVMEGSVLDPNTAAMRQGAEYTFPVGTALAMLPGVGPLLRATKGLPVGMGIKHVGKNIFEDAIKYHQKIPEIKSINVNNLKRMNAGEVADVSDEVAAKMDFSKPIQVSVFSDGELRIVDGHHRVAAAKKLGIQSLPVELQAINAKGSTLNKLSQESTYPQQAALNLAQQRAALPVEQGGLGLLESNTAEQRAAAMGGKDMVHFSRTGGDYTTLDSGKFAIAPFDAVGTHVGTPQAAMDRFRNTTATTDQIKGTTYPVTILGDRPLMNQNGMPFGEDDLNALLRQQGGHNWSDIQGGKMTYQDMNANLRKKLFEDQGYTSIPYFNEVEGKGSISYIVPPENIRSRFAAFDPFRRSAAIAATMGVAAPDLLASPIDEEELRRLQSGLLYAP